MILTGYIENDFEIPKITKDTNHKIESEYSQNVLNAKTLLWKIGLLTNFTEKMPSRLFVASSFHDCNANCKKIVYQNSINDQ